MAMNPSKEFLKNTVECKRMAKFTRDSGNKAAWTHMAERWQRCAEWFESENLDGRPPSPEAKPVALLRWANH